MDTTSGYSGRVLRVDLSTGRIAEERTDPGTLRMYVGGTGLGARCIYEEVPAGVEWSDAGNRLVIASGPLGGTRVGGSGTVSVVTKGPLTNGAVATQANGFLGAYLRFCGYDAIILQGKSKDWVYLHVQDGKAELRDARRLLGVDTYETGDRIRSELGADERAMAVASIGPAGENLVRFAAICFDKGHVASHNGVGAVMGSKKLKAIAVSRGAGRPSAANREALSKTADQLHEFIVNDPVASVTYKWGTLSGVVRSTTAKDGVLPVKNYTTSTYEIEPEKLEKFSPAYIRGHFDPKPAPCWACRMHHCHMITIPEGAYAGMVLEEPEYEQFAAFGPAIGQTDVNAAMMLSREVDGLGMDANEAGWLIGLVMECYEKGLLNKASCDGLEMTWGNAEATRELMRRVATRQGFGDTLGEGVMRAAKAIGGDAPARAVHTMKGNTPRGHDHRSRWPMLFDTCVSQMSTDEGYTVVHPEAVGISVKPSIRPNSSAEDAVAWNSQCKGAIQFEDCLGVCRFCTRTDMVLLPKAVSAATGWDFTPAEAFQVGQRIVNLFRLFNMRHGHTADMDAPSPRYGSAPVDGPSQGKNIMASWNDMRSRYYELMGWDRATGMPLPETLKKLGIVQK